MRRDEFVGKAQTVLGLIDANSLGVTLPHEHILLDSSAFYFVEPTGVSEKKMAHEPLSLTNLYWVKSHPLSHLDDLKLTDEQTAIEEAKFFKEAGGNTIVELSSIGTSRDPLGLARVAGATGLNVIMGTSYYIGLSHPPELATKTEDEITEEIVRDIMIGVGDTGVRAGIIGEVGCSKPLEETERKVLRASVAAQQQTGAAINIHPSPSDDLVMEIVKILRDAGADLNRTIISHVDLLCFNGNTLRELMDAGCCVEYDGFGRVWTIPQVYQGRFLEPLTSSQRIDAIIQLVAEGYLSQILVSHDICFKHLLVRYGGYGYAHILRDVVPLMRLKGMSDEQIHTLLVENPKRVLTFTPAEER